MSELITLNCGINNSRRFQRTLEDTTRKIEPKVHKSGPAGPSPISVSLLRSSFSLRRLICVSKIYTINLRWFIVGASNGD